MKTALVSYGFNTKIFVLSGMLPMDLGKLTQQGVLRGRGRLAQAGNLEPRTSVGGVEVCREAPRYVMRAERSRSGLVMRCEP